MKASGTTILRLGSVEAPIALFKVTGSSPGKVEWDLAGPNGGTLETPEEARAASDPIFVSSGATVKTTGASGRARITQINTEDGRPFRVEKGTGERVYRGKERKGIRLDDGQFIDVTDQLERIREVSKLEEMRITSFLRRERVPREAIQGAYWIGVNGPSAPRALRLLQAALRKTARVAKVKWTTREVQSNGVIVPHASGALLALKLAWPDEVRNPNDEPRITAYYHAEVTEREIDFASRLIAAMSESAQVLDDAEDDAAVLQRGLAQMARRGEDVTDFLAEVPDHLDQGLLEELVETLVAADG